MGYSFAAGAPGARRGGLRALLVPALLSLTCACSEAPGDGAADVEVNLSFAPSPHVGPTVCTVRLEGADGAPLAGAAVEVEGNMNHAGMVPVFASLAPKAPGTYASDFAFTMGGDWYVVVRGQLADGRTLERIFDLPAVPSNGTEGACCDPVER